MVRILVVITTSFVPYGGLASVMMNFYRAIDKTRFHIDFASTNLELNPKLALELKQNGSKYYGLGNRKKFIINYAKSLDRVLKNGKYDVIHVNSNSAMYTIRLVVLQDVIKLQTNWGENILTYMLLFLQVIFEHMDRHFDIGQIICLISICLINYRLMQTMIEMLKNRILQRRS